MHAVATTTSLAAHCLFPGDGSPVSGPLDQYTYCSSASPSSPRNLSGTNSSGRSNTAGSRMASGWYPHSSSPLPTSYAAPPCDRSTKSRRARPNCSGTGGCIRSTSYTVDRTSAISLTAANPASPPSPPPSTRRTSSRSRRRRSSRPGLPTSMTRNGRNTEKPPNALKPSTKRMLLMASSLLMPCSFSAMDTAAAPCFSTKR
ncbi:Os02g0110101 [Oryza sativa Japonica Group]|uniref:Os02g0110101 protein n=1 Tax=Oryza sativa subsp. japonica TaxID=39947 RepID=A0A0P0VDS7_ORYSJ|nr:hypothetical protein EE612_008362 [Oryza sativa]BAS76607.1 Os02g0110101 [Oryza sativa Japonica Group]